MAWPDARHWGSTEAERGLPFACDRHLPAGDDAVFRAIAIAAPAELVFRWLCQLRAAPYSYDWVDNFGRRSPPQLRAGLDELRVGQSVMRIFDLVEFEAPRHLTLRTRRSRLFGQYAVTYLVRPAGEHHSRLIVKLLIALPSSPLRSYPLRHLGPLADLVMMRKQFLTLKAYAERDARATAVR